MKRSLLYPALLVAAISLAGCMKMDCGCDPRDGHDDDPRMYHKSPVLFQYEYINYAWGYKHHGFMIDSRGVIRAFRQPKNWIEMDSTGLLTEMDIRYNLAQCDTVCGTVDLRDLEKYYGQINDIRKGEILDNGMVMADAGTGVLSAWDWNEKAGKYENVLLASNGDYQKVNTHPDVAEIIAWLRWIGAKTNTFWWYGN